MKFKYKEIKILVPFCPKCDKQLDSVYLPTPYTWKCDCGYWKMDYSKGEYDVMSEMLMLMPKLKSKIDYINYLKEHGVTKLPRGWSIKDAVDAIEQKEKANRKYEELMNIQ